ncbi:MAG: LysM peptidoglycan-binding domain-containing protein [Candidatus Spyradosoma sp.]
MEDSSMDTGFDAPADLKIPIGLGILGIIVGGLALIIAFVDRGKVSRFTEKVDADIEDVRATVNKTAAGQDAGGNAKEVAELRRELEALRAQVAASFESVNANHETLAQTVESLSRRRGAAPAADGNAPRGNAAAQQPQQRASTETPAAAATGEYKIEPGDNFWKIAKKFGCKVADLEALNPDVDSSRLRVGQKIKVPAK